MKSLYNGTLKKYCRSIDELVRHPEQAATFAHTEPKRGDQLIVHCNDTPLVIHITHSQYVVQAEAWLVVATLVGIRDMSPEDKACAQVTLSSEEGGELNGLWHEGVYTWGEQGKMQDYRQWVIGQLLHPDINNEDTYGNALCRIRLKNELANLNLTNYGDNPLFVEGFSMKEMIKCARPASDNLPIVGNFNFRRDKEAFMATWKTLNDELNSLRRVGVVSGLTEKVKQDAAALILRIGAFAQTYTRVSEWKLITLWALRITDIVKRAPMFSTVDDVLAPVKGWLNEFVFPER